MWEFKSAGVLNGAQFLLTQGMDPTATVAGGGEDFFGTGGRAVLLRATFGEFSAFDVLANRQVDFRQAFTVDGTNPLQIDSRTQVVGDAGNYFGDGSHAIYIRGSSGAQHAWGFSGNGVRTHVQ